MLALFGYSNTEGTAVEKVKQEQEGRKQETQLLDGEPKVREENEVSYDGEEDVEEIAVDSLEDDSVSKYNFIFYFLYKFKFEHEQL